jgi:hypothetical protein
MAHSGAKRKQEAAIAALLTQGTIERAAKAAEIGPRTLHRWLRMPAFQADYRQARQHAFAQTIARLQQGSTAAATVLLKLAVDAATPASVRVRAADSIINRAMKATTIEAIEARALDAETEKALPMRLRAELLCPLDGMEEGTLPYRTESPSMRPELVPDRRELYGIQEFLQGYCMVAPTGDADSWKKERWWVPAADLYPAYATWASATGDRHPYRKRSFEERLHELGREKARVRPDGGRESRQIWVWLGIRLMPAREHLKPAV